jgi:hypothetical protein
MRSAHGLRASTRARDTRMNTQQIRAELERGDADAQRIALAIAILREGRAGHHEKAALTDVRFGVLSPRDFAAAAASESARSAKTGDSCALLELAFENRLVVEEEELLLGQLCDMTDAPGELIGRTERGFCMLFPWTDEAQAAKLEKVAAGMASYAAPALDASVGSIVIREAMAAADLPAIEVAQATGRMPYRAPAYAQAPGRRGRT